LAEFITKDIIVFSHFNLNVKGSIGKFYTKVCELFLYLSLKLVHFQVGLLFRDRGSDI